MVVATGSDAVIPPVPGLRELDGVWTNREVTGMKAIPRRLLILGGGPVGAEMAQAVNATASELVKHMQPVQRDSLKIVVQKWMEDGAKADLKRWMQAIEITACRAGLLLCADLEIAKKIITAEPQLPGDLGPADKMKELLVFSVSEQYFSLRKALGIAVG